MALERVLELVCHIDSSHMLVPFLMQILLVHGHGNVCSSAPVHNCCNTYSLHVLGEVQNGVYGHLLAGGDRIRRASNM